MNHSLIAVLLLCIISGFVNAQGWVISDDDGSTTYISGDWIRIEDPDEGSFSSIFNMESKSLIIISHQNESYADGTMSDYCNAIKAMTSGMMEGMTPEQREMMEAYMSKSQSGPPPSVKIEHLGSGGNIAGYNTEKYKVMVDGELYEEIWISKEGDLKTLVEMFSEKVEPLTSEMVKCSAVGINFEQDPEFSEAYKELQRSGMELKSMRYEYGTPIIGSSVNSIERKSIPASEFKPPAGYSKVEFGEFMGSLNEDEDY